MTKSSTNRPLAALVLLAFCVSVGCSNVRTVGVGRITPEAAQSLVGKTASFHTDDGVQTGKVKSIDYPHLVCGQRRKQSPTSPYDTVVPVRIDLRDVHKVEVHDWTEGTRLGAGHLPPDEAESLVGKRVRLHTDDGVKAGRVKTVEYPYVLFTQKHRSRNYSPSRTLDEPVQMRVDLRDVHKVEVVEFAFVKTLALAGGIYIGSVALFYILVAAGVIEFEFEFQG